MNGFRARFCALVAQQLRAPLPAGKKGAKDRGPAKVGQLSAQAVTGCAIKKGQEDPPIKPDSEYPPWLFELMKPEASLMELERVYATEGLALGDLRRLYRAKNKQRIKENNAARAKS